MKSFVTTRIKSFGYAFSGIRYVIRTQKNAWVHLVATILVVLIGWWLKLAPLQWALVVLAIGLVWLVECINTAIEAIVDMISPQHNSRAKVCKDAAAAAVLVAAFCAVMIGLLVLGPPLLERLVWS